MVILLDAMMASMSVPGALPPYEVEGRMLVDGGVTTTCQWMLLEQWEPTSLLP